MEEKKRRKRKRKRGKKKNKVSILKFKKVYLRNNFYF